MIEQVDSRDLPEIARVVESVIRDSVAKDESDVQFLLDDVGHDLREWQEDPSDKLHLKFVNRGRIEGSILVKNWWNLCLLFVLPDAQGSGVGRSLVQTAIAECADRSPRNAIWVNSSCVGEGFYRHLGFQTNGSRVERPGGCIPLRLEFQ